MKELILCRIANKIDTATACCLEFPEFEYNGQRWRALEFLRNQHELMTLLNSDANQFIMRDLKCIINEVAAEADVKQLAIATLSAPISPRYNSCLLDMQKRLFPLIFRNYAESTKQKHDTPNSDEDEQEEMQDYVTTALYDALYDKHLSSAAVANTATELTLPQYFLPTLCRYQERTVRWLLQREQQVACFPAYYTRLEAKDNCTVLYKHNFSAHLQLQPPPDIQLAPGGILADEMGLGKTVEILALIILNPRPRSTSLANELTICNALQPPIKRARTEQIVFCICGNSTSKKNIILCSLCKLWQHSACVCKFDESYADDNSYLCPSCWHSKTQAMPLQAPTTFIVSPSTIKTQWLAEIRRHINPTLRVFDYNEAVASAWVSPQQLMRYDIVLIDYWVLRREIYHTTEYVSERKMRNPQRCMRRLSPLLMLQWWRVCLDEAQMVESNTSHITAMVHKLPAVNRWAVTGTPIQRSIDDLHSLLQFIGFKDVCEPLFVWQHLVHDFVRNYEETAEKTQLIEILQKCMWRTCKPKVIAELNIPPQVQQVHRLHLSNLEKLFYMEQHALCRSSFDHMVNKYLTNSNVIVKISPQIMKLILQPVLKIRQSCIMPVVSNQSGNQKLNAGSVGQKLFLRPKDLHTHLKSTNEVECKSELRSMASSYNGMAAIYFIRKNYSEAIRHYEMVLRLARDYKEMKISVDSLLQIHALHNLLQAYYSSPGLRHPTSEQIAEYDKNYHALEWKYLEPYAATMLSVRTSYLNSKQSLTALQSSVDTNLLDFISELINRICDENEDFQRAVLNKIHDEFVSIFSENPKLGSLYSMRGVLYVITLWHQKMESALQSLDAQFEALKFYTNNVRPRDQVKPAIWREMMQLVRSVYECHLSELLEDNKKQSKSSTKKSQKPHKPLCRLCQMRDALNNFECLLFSKIVDEETNITEGLENPSMEVLLIKLLFGFLRTKSNFLHFKTTMDKLWEAIECRQALCKKLIKYWIEIEYTVKAYDELDMCKMRISLANKDEENTHYKISLHEVDATLREQETTLFTAQRQFAMKFARLKYIMHLEADPTTGPCPICQSEDESRFAVFECGHNICILCLRTIRRQGTHPKLSCPICRNQQSSDKIYYVTRAAITESEELIQVAGDYSTKIIYIVRLILKLKSEHSNDLQSLKILIFSQWIDILNAIAAALKENGIRHRAKWTPRIIDEFKNPQLGITCLLMPLSKGCNGLNLIEATHVFLVEPILNPGEEAQAIGRVHRFGQTKSTTVHRFIVCNTIEENIFNVVSAGLQSQSHWDFKNMTVDSLRNLFHLENDVSDEYDSVLEVQAI